ncbi:hypothetical protein HB662_05565 [Roseomonas frigidaquae]|uniref:Uncharacterized protein n=1 Tax=Falsiroseomonas frigidaquae TaxID=487318 RepID=A0ABX1EUL2_9PROT|nr:hypothetical protein [Falsiroseomonas frigidaquae]NKE44235.1 hypothetical protein [Falsiroseomonas frigidaquae]
MMQQAVTLPLAPGLGSLQAEQPAFLSLPRHGRRPLGFHGRLLLQVSAREPTLPVWSDVTVHESVTRHLVIAIRHALREDRSVSRDYAEACDGPDVALAFLHAHDPLHDLPVEALYAAAEGLAEPARHQAAAACAQRLRQSWREVLSTCFGHRNPQGDLR